MRYLIDENLPDCLRVWSYEKFLHVTKIAKSIFDNDIWKYALENNLIILTKDTDFHEGILYREPPPKVILFKLGNTSTLFLEEFLLHYWPEIEDLINSLKLVIVYRDKIEGLK
jgi:predicted nuclease of predicted toxin-antitoxin system